MGYGFLYYLLFLIIIMFLFRFFLPILVYLIPVFLVIYIVKSLFTSRRNTNSDSTYYEDTNHNQSSDPNVIDVDYKVVDEEDNDTQ